MARIVIRNIKLKNTRKKLCQFDIDKIEYINYKDVELLKNYINSHSKILPSRVTGTCARHQRLLAKAIKRSRHMALLSYVEERIRR